MEEILKSKLKKISDDVFHGDEPQEIKDLKYSLGRALYIYNSLHNVKYADNTFKLSIEKNPYLYMEELKKYLINNKYTLEHDLEKIVDHFIDLNNKQIEKLKSMNFKKYYGSIGFIFNRIMAINTAVHDMNISSDINDKTQIKKCVDIMEYIDSLIKKDYPNITELPEYESDYKGKYTDIDYDKLSYYYEKAMQVENELIPLSEKIWNDYYEKNNFYLLHCLSGDIVEGKVMDKVCTSLFTDKLFTPAYGNTGYLYKPDFKYIDSICPEDVGSWFVNNDISEGFNLRFQYDGSKIQYECGNYTKLFLPSFIEEMGMENNGEYTEILLLNPNHDLVPEEAFYMDNATEEEKQKIIEIAKIQNIPVREIRKNDYSLNSR